jgi:regulator of sigma E protease
MGLFIAILLLSMLIFLHELGHFFAARAFGVRVEVFSIGFGKKLLSYKIGHTQWSLSAIPLGGYVQMKGQDDTNPQLRSSDPDAYSTKRPWQRIIILFAGPFANFLVAFILYLFVASLGVPKLLADIGEVGNDSPAYHAKLQKGDQILKINGADVTFWEEIAPRIESSPQGVALLIERERQLLDIQLTPKLIEDKNIFGERIERYIIGIKPLGSTRIESLNFPQTLHFAWQRTQEASMMILLSIQKLITGVIGSENVNGVITIVDVTAKMSDRGIVALLLFTALISINLGVLNLLPIPALDGGHILFNLYEMASQKPPSTQAMLTLTLMGWGLLGSLMLLGIYNDINRLLG